MSVLSAICYFAKDSSSTSITYIVNHNFGFAWACKTSRLRMTRSCLFADLKGVVISRINLMQTAVKPWMSQISVTRCLLDRFVSSRPYKTTFHTGSVVSLIYRLLPSTFFPAPELSSQRPARTRLVDEDIHIISYDRWRIIPAEKSFSFQVVTVL